jgi:hypothetical protein
MVQNTKLFSKILSSLLMTLLLKSCMISQYVPNTQNVPLFKEKGTFQGQFSFTNYQAGYSITNHLAVVANYFYKDRTGNDANFLSEYRPQYRSLTINEAETGFGIYNNTKFVFYEIFMGLGYGKTIYHHTYSGDYSGMYFDYSYRFISNSVKLYIQPDIGFHIDQGIIAISCKFLDFKYSNISCDFNGIENLNEVGLPYDLILSNTKNYNLYFIQPCITIRPGVSDYLQFQFQLGHSYCLNQNISNLNFKGVFFDFGIGIKISKLFKK